MSTKKKKKKKCKQVFIDQVAPHYSAEPQEALEVDYFEPQHSAKLQKTKAIVAFEVKPWTSDGRFESDLLIPAAGQAFSSCSSSNHWQACAAPYSRTGAL